MMNGKFPAPALKGGNFRVLDDGCRLLVDGFQWMGLLRHSAALHSSQ